MLSKIFKSKTIDTNIIAGALVTLLKAFGIEIPLNIVTAGFVILNFILRLITREPISAK